MGLSLGDSKIGEKQVRTWVDAALATRVGDSAKDKVLAALNVDIVWSSHLLNRSQWFLLVPNTEAVMRVHTKAIEGANGVEHKQLSNSHVMLYTAASIQPLIELLLLWYRGLEGGSWGVKTLIAYRCVRESLDHVYESLLCCPLQL